MGMKWASTFCPQAKFVMKIDDDILLNSYRIIGYLNNITQENSNLRNTLLGLVYENFRVIRENSKFSISKKEYADEFYPPYCDGSAYIVTRDLAANLYLRSLQTKNFVFEDVYIGMLAKQLNSSFINLKNYRSFIDSSFDLQTFTSSYFEENYFYHLEERNMMFGLWKAILDSLFSYLFNL